MGRRASGKPSAGSTSSRTPTKRAGKKPAHRPPLPTIPPNTRWGATGSGRPLKDFSSKAFRGRREFSYLSRLSRLPTEPEALRLTIENRRGGSAPVEPSPADSPRGGATVERLLEILSEPIMSRAVRAAAFNASEILAEAEMIFNAKAADYPGVPDHTVFRETAYLQTGVIDSMRERPGPRVSR